MIELIIVGAAVIGIAGCVWGFVWLMRPMPPREHLEWGTRIGDGSVVDLETAIARYTITPESVRVRTVRTFNNPDIQPRYGAWRIPTREERLGMWFG